VRTVEACHSSARPADFDRAIVDAGIDLIEHI
jgi:hypothetical protein